MNTVNSDFQNIMISLEEAQKYECRVEHYTIGHRQIRIRMNKPMGFVTDEEAFYLIFTGVIYFQGPLQWIGANFSLGTPSELTSILKQIPNLLIQYVPPVNYNNLDNQNKTEFKLIQFGPEKFPTRIIAKYVSKADVSKYKSKQSNI